MRTRVRSVAPSGSPARGARGVTAARPWTVLLIGISRRSGSFKFELSQNRTGSFEFEQGFCYALFVTGTRWLTDEEKRAWHAFVAASALVDRRLDQQLKESVGISHLQYGILVQLSGTCDREMRMTELAAALLNS